MIRQAAGFAKQANEGKMRKGTAVPYIVHPMDTGVIVSRMTDDPEVISAALLHDVIEDAGVTKEELEERFGSRVAELVAAESEDKSRTWKERKQATIDRLTDAGLDGIECTHSDHTSVETEAFAAYARSRALLETVRLVAIPFAPGYPLSPLHWHIADSTGSLVVESMADGLHIYENPVGVMTNNPPFPYHLMRLNDYQALSPRQPENRFAPALDLRCYGQGMGAIGLPGDASPMSRFVQAAFLKSHAVFEEDAQARVEQFFHILRAVGMVRGSVITPEGKFDETIYSCCIDAANGMYYYTTYFNSRVTAISLFDEPLDGNTARAFPLERAPQFHYVNRA